MKKQTGNLMIVALLGIMAMIGLTNYSIQKPTENKTKIELTNKPFSYYLINGKIGLVTEEVAEHLNENNHVIKCSLNNDSNMVVSYGTK